MLRRNYALVIAVMFESGEVGDGRDGLILIVRRVNGHSTSEE